MNWLKKLWADIVLGCSLPKNNRPIRDLKLPPGYSNVPDDPVDMCIWGIIPDEHMYDDPELP